MRKLFRSVTSTTRCFFKSANAARTVFSYSENPIIRLLNLQLHRQRCSRLERLNQSRIILYCFKTQHVTRGVVNFYSAGDVTVERRIGSVEVG
jgi:hypothetical protein